MRAVWGVDVRRALEVGNDDGLWRASHPALSNKPEEWSVIPLSSDLVVFVVGKKQGRWLLAENFGPLVADCPSGDEMRPCYSW